MSHASDNSAVVETGGKQDAPVSLSVFSNISVLFLQLPCSNTFKIEIKKGQELAERRSMINQ